MNNNNADNVNGYEYFRRIIKRSKDIKGGFKVIMPSHITPLEQKFDCIVEEEYSRFSPDDIPDMANINIFDYKKKFKQELEDFLKGLHTLGELRKPLFRFIKRTEELYEEMFNNAYNRIILLSTVDDEQIRGYFSGLIIIEKVLINIKNIFIT